MLQILSAFSSRSGPLGMAVWRGVVNHWKYNYVHYIFTHGLGSKTASLKPENILEGSGCI